MNTVLLCTPHSEVRVTTTPAEVLITFSGELDLSLADQFAPLPGLVTTWGLPVSVDLSEVTLFGAWAADALLALRAAAPASFTVSGSSEEVRRTLDACGLSLTEGVPA